MHLFVHFIFTTTTRRSCCGGRRAVCQLPIQFICATSHGSPVPPHFMSSDRLGYHTHTHSHTHTQAHAISRWMKTNCGSAAAQLQLQWSSVPFSSIRFRLTAHVSFTFLCLFASLGFRFLFVNNNFFTIFESELQMHLQHQHSAIYLVDTCSYSMLHILFTLLNLFCNCL